MKPIRLQHVCIFLVLLFPALAIVGAFRQYTPVPWMDMWDSYIGFYLQYLRGNGSAWWAQHNEHRIVLARIFFWMDLAWFSGAGWFLILVNYLLVLLTAVVLHAFIKAEMQFHAFLPLNRLLLLTAMVVLVFSWVQRDNLTWGFQSQFILAQLLPLTGFYCLQRSLQTVSSRHFWFAMACVMGVASLGTMANGVLALPVLLLYALWGRMDVWRILLLLLLTVAGDGFYFHDYVRPESHGDTVQTLLTHPLAFLQYVLLYLGAPFYRFFMGGYAGKAMAYLAGVTLMLGAMLLTLRRMTASGPERQAIGLHCFILYVGGTAAATASARLVFGLDSAFSGRYTTPTLMAWAAFLILAQSVWIPGLVSRYRRWTLPAALLLLLMLVFQCKALRNVDARLFEQRVAALALALDIPDDEQVRQVYPVPDAVRPTARRAADLALSIFAAPDISQARQVMGATIAAGTTERICEGSTLVPTMLPGKQWMRIEGTIRLPDASSEEAVVMLDTTAHAVAYVLLMPASQHGEGQYFKGYARLVEGRHALLVLQGGRALCHLQIN